jgi:hypothetical protein
MFPFLVKKSALYMDMFWIKFLFMFLGCFVSLQRIDIKKFGYRYEKNLFNQ